MPSGRATISSRLAAERSQVTQLTVDLRARTERLKAAEAQGDLLESRRHEHLLAPDEDVVKVRRLITRAFVQQHRGDGRLAVPAGALDFPC